MLNKKVLRNRLQKLLPTEHGRWSSRQQVSSGSETDISTSFTSDASLPPDLSNFEIVFQEDEEQITPPGDTDTSASVKTDQQEIRLKSEQK